MLQTAMMFFRASLLRSAVILLASSLTILSVPPAYADEATKGNDSGQIMRDFSQQQIDKERAKSITDKDKHQVMFMMGAVLLVLLLITGGLGIAMGVYGKPVFLAHMIFAGLSITLALAHAITGIVWFYPF